MADTKKKVFNAAYQQAYRARRRLEAGNMTPYNYAASLDGMLNRLLGRSYRDDKGCLIWLGGCNRAGYGLVAVAGRSLLVHRLVAIITDKATDQDEAVRHSCDNPSCIESQHLTGGTHEANRQDAIDKGRLKHAHDTPWLRDRAHHPKAKPVTDPNGRQWPSAALAAEAWSTSPRNVQRWASGGLNGWSK